MLQKTQNLDIAENLSFMKHCKVSCKQLDVTLLDLLLNILWNCSAEPAWNTFFL